MLYRVIAIVVLIFLLQCPAEAQKSQSSQMKIINVSGEVYESEAITENIGVEPYSKVLINTTKGVSGGVSIKAIDGDYKIKYYKKMKARSMEEAQNFANYLDVNMWHKDGTLVVDVKAQMDSPWRGTDQSAMVQIELTVPESLLVEIDAQNFDTQVVGPFSTVTVKNEFGRIKVSDVTEKLMISSSNSQVSINKIRGEVEVYTSNNMIRAQDVNTGDHAAIFSNEYGVIEVSNFVGRIDCVTSYASVDLRGLKLTGDGSRVITSYGSIDAEIIELRNTELYFEDNFSNVEITLPENVRSAFDLNVDRGGRIQMTGIPVTPEELQSERLLATTDDPDSKIRVQIAGIGTVSIKGRKVYGTTP